MRLELILPSRKYLMAINAMRFGAIAQSSLRPQTALSIMFPRAELHALQRFASHIQRNCNDALAGRANPESAICNDTVWTFLPWFPQKSFASRYMSAFGPSAGPNPTCALRLDTVYVSPSIGTTPVLEHAAVKQARTSIAV